MSETIGALVIGGNYRGLSIARSLGRRGVRVWVATAPDDQLAGLSRYTKRILPWIQNGDAEQQVAYLLRIAAQHQLDQWVLFPTGDESAALLSRFHDELSPRFRLTTPAWDVMRWAYDKCLTYRLAAKQQVDFPWTLCPSSELDLQTGDFPFPLILKPSTHAVASRFTMDKAWPAVTRAELVARYREARELIPADQILVQEMIPGGGEAQFSFTALCHDGRVVASLTARRTRQYPIDFGHSSCLVEILPVPEVEDPAGRLLAAMRYSGLVEVEFKFDARDGRYKVLDINPRLWTWSPLCSRAGVDYPYLLWQLVLGEPISPVIARSDVRWVRMSTDIPAALQEMGRGRLSPGAYLRSLRSPCEFALLSSDDPLPWLLEIPIRLYLAGMKLVGRGQHGSLAFAPVAPIGTRPSAQMKRH